MRCAALALLGSIACTTLASPAATSAPPAARTRGAEPPAATTPAARDAILAAATARVRSDRAPPVHDPALDEVARAAAASASADHVIAAGVLRDAMARHLGSGLDPYLLAARGDDAAVRDQLDAAIAELRAQAGIASVGVASSGTGAARVIALVAMPPPTLPVAIERDGAIARVIVPWSWPAPPLAFDVTGETTRRLDVTAGARGAELAVDCRSGASRTIELDAGDQLVARVVNVCAPAPPIAAAAVELGPPARTAIEIEQRLFELVNRERVAAGAAPVAWDARAHAFARAQSARMEARGYIGHVAPDGEDLAGRVARSDLAAAETWENVGLADGPGLAHTAFVASPGHRANLLAARARRGAVGIAPATREPGWFYVTEIFFEPR